MSSIKPVFPRHEQWQVAHFHTPPFQDLLPVFHKALLSVEQWPNVTDYAHYLTLDSLANYPFRLLPDHGDTEASEQAATNALASRYYEQIIFEDNTIPTRSNNWHDFYNACIWRCFPHTKRQLNVLHMQDISQYGVSPRTPRRDRITHFDECGIILAYSSSTVPDLLAQHQWVKAFHGYRAEWGNTVRAFVFGHANYEMLMHPHIGLTGKWLGVAVDKAFWQASLREQYARLDEQVAQYASREESFTVKQHLKPLPLLGVPGWWAENQHEAFYHNTQYFRPKRATA